MELDKRIEQYEERRWIDCAWDDINDEKEFELILTYLKENKQLKQKLEKTEELCKRIRLTGIPSCIDEHTQHLHVKLEAKMELVIELEEILGEQDQEAVKNE